MVKGNDFIEVITGIAKSRRTPILRDNDTLTLPSPIKGEGKTK
jgi:hypothetical protein